MKLLIKNQIKPGKKGKIFFFGRKFDTQQTRYVMRFWDPQPTHTREQFLFCCGLIPMIEMEFDL